MPMISIIVDDLGNNPAFGYRAARLPREVALSILPHTPYSQQIAIYGHQRGMDILLHQPMESLHNQELLGPGALLRSMDRQQFARTLEINFNAIPYVVGINNHMGSILTADGEKMSWLMAELKLRSIFFIDSRTTTETVAAITAEYWHVPNISRMVFLDHLDEPTAIAEQYQRLLQLAVKHGHATAIGHPRENTLRFLEQNLPLLKSLGLKLVSPSNAIKTLFSNHFENNQIVNKTPSERFYDGCYSSERIPPFNKFMRPSLLYIYQCF